MELWLSSCQSVSARTEEMGLGYRLSLWESFQAFPLAVEVEMFSFCPGFKWGRVGAWSFLWSFLLPHRNMGEGCHPRGNESQKWRNMPEELCFCPPLAERVQIIPRKTLGNVLTGERVSGFVWWVLSPRNLLVTLPAVHRMPIAIDCSVNNLPISHLLKVSFAAPPNRKWILLPYFLNLGWFMTYFEEQDRREVCHLQA